MKLTEKIAWLMGRVQKSLFPHLNECLPTLLTEQEKRLVSILEIVEVERHVPRIVTRRSATCTATCIQPGQRFSGEVSLVRGLHGLSRHLATMVTGSLVNERTLSRTGRTATALPPGTAQLSMTEPRERSHKEYVACDACARRLHPSCRDGCLVEGCLNTRPFLACSGGWPLTNPIKFWQATVPLSP